MPFRAFGDSERKGKAEPGKAGKGKFQCPFGHSGILNSFLDSLLRQVARLGFNALSGIRGF